MTELEQNLKKRGYEFAEADTPEEAVAYLTETLSGKSVAFGGSVTLQQLGIYDALRNDCRCVWHWKDGSLSDAAGTQVYLTSANAVARTGEIVNMDGTCNRVASTLFGHEEVVFVIGENKVTPDLSAAIDRVRNVAGPQNARRLGKNTPCVADGRCHDCLSPDCICSALCILRKKPSSCRAAVVLIHRPLGY